MLNTLFYWDSLSLIMMLLVGFIGLIVASFAYRYLDGNRKKPLFFMQLGLLLLSVFIMVSSDHLLLFWISWGASNTLLTWMILHKYQWQAAKASAVLTLKNFALGWFFLAAALGVFYTQTGETSIQTILVVAEPSLMLTLGLFLLALAAMSQSALWPFHSWLLSSLNAPTPVSAIMHAGLVNAGGFVLVRFAPLLLEQPGLLTGLFVLGITTTLVGTLWKLMQPNIKRMLACSTMGQMGFMIAQCGLGLFPAAVAHLCWHGLFKAYLFLTSASAAQEKRLPSSNPPSAIAFTLALACGLMGTLAFAWFGNKTTATLDTRIFLLAVALITGTQMALTLLNSLNLKHLLLAIVTTTSAGALYGLSVRLVEAWLQPLQIAEAQPLNWVHALALVAILASWLFLLFINKLSDKQFSKIWLKGYVWMLNASQPAAKTITAHRNDYQQ